MVKSIHRVITFYSYKGGVGRSMAMANIAVLLSQWGYKTLVVDWDLEAPGLENFYQTLFDTSVVKQKKGLIDLLLLKHENKSIEASTLNWHEYITEIPIPNAVDKLHFISAGKRDDDYVRKIKQFDYTSFYEEEEGGGYIEDLRNYWLDQYNFILIDSRTGLTDSSGVCSIHMPDILILLFTPNEQSFNGIKRVARRAMEGQSQIMFDRFQLRTLPIPSRIESQETILQDEWMKKIYSESDDMLQWLPKGGDEYRHLLITPAELLNQMKIPYKTYYAYGERLAVIERGTSDPLDVGYAYETIASILANDFQDADMLKSSRDNYIRKAKGETFADDHEYVRQIDLERKEKERAISEITEENEKLAQEIKRKARRVRQASFIRVGGYLLITAILLVIAYKYYERKESEDKIKAQYFDFVKSYNASDSNQLDYEFNNKMLIEYYKLPPNYRDSAIEIKNTIEKAIAYKYYDKLEYYYNTLIIPGFKASSFFRDSISEFGSLTNITPVIIQQKIDSIKKIAAISNNISDTATINFYSDSGGFYIEYIEKGNFLLDTKLQYSSLKNKALVCFEFNGKIKSYTYSIIEGIPFKKKQAIVPPETPDPEIRRISIELFICSSIDTKSYSEIVGLVRKMNEDTLYTVHTNNNYKTPSDTSSPYYSSRNEIRYSGKFDYRTALTIRNEFIAAGFDMELRVSRVRTKNPINIFLCYQKLRALRTKTMVPKTTY